MFKLTFCMTFLIRFANVICTLELLWDCVNSRKSEVSVPALHCLYVAHWRALQHPSAVRFFRYKGAASISDPLSDLRGPRRFPPTDNMKPMDLYCGFLRSGCPILELRPLLNVKRHGFVTYNCVQCSGTVEQCSI